MKKEVFNDVVAFLYEQQQNQPLDGLVFYPGVDTDIDVYEIYASLLKLKNDHGVVEEIHIPITFEYPFNEDNPYPFLGDDPHNLWEVNLSDKFPDWADKFLHGDAAELFPHMEIKILPDRSIVLNDLYVLSKPHIESENELVFKFLFDHPNRMWSKEEVRKGAKLVQISKTFDKIVDNLGFKNDLRKVFWQVSDGKIQFSNPVSAETMRSLGISKIRI